MKKNNLQNESIDLRSDHFFNNYRVVRFIGSGSYSIVLEVELLYLNREKNKAIKICFDDDAIFDKDKDKYFSNSFFSGDNANANSPEKLIENLQKYYPIDRGYINNKNKWMNSLLYLLMLKKCVSLESTSCEKEFTKVSRIISKKNSKNNYDLSTNVLDRNGEKTLLKFIDCWKEETENNNQIYYFLSNVYQNDLQGYKKNITDPDWVNNIIYQVAVGLRYIHKNQFFHHDLKLDNIFLNEYEKYHNTNNPDEKQFKIVIGDFGLGRTKFESIVQGIKNEENIENYILKNPKKSKAPLSTFEDRDYVSTRVFSQNNKFHLYDMNRLFYIYASLSYGDNEYSTFFNFQNFDLLLFQKPNDDNLNNIIQQKTPILYNYIKYRKNLDPNYTCDTFLDELSKEQNTKYSQYSPFSSKIRKRVDTLETELMETKTELKETKTELMETKTEIKKLEFENENLNKKINDIVKSNNDRFNIIESMLSDLCDGCKNMIKAKKRKRDKLENDDENNEGKPPNKRQKIE